MLWKHSDDNYKTYFSSSSTWEQVRDKKPTVFWSKAVWFTQGVPRFSFIVWLAVKNRLSTGDRLLKWNPQAMSTCWLCKSVAETRDHLFFECTYSEVVWRGTIKDLAGLGVSSKWSRLIRKLETGLQNRTLTFLFRYCFQALVYAIWFERNARRVGEPPKPASLLILYIDKLVRNRISSLRKPGWKHEKAMEAWFGRR